MKWNPGWKAVGKEKNFIISTIVPNLKKKKKGNKCTGTLLKCTGTPYAKRDSG